jgi:predicted TIM-barrel fold metal-dependent hydrolase
MILAAAVACAAQPLRGQAELPLRPVADHHAHLQSKAIWLLFHEELPIIALPADLDSLLSAFEQGWRAGDNKTALAALFTEDGIFQYADDWIRGRPAIRMFLLGRGEPLRLRPQVFEAHAPLGYIAGAYGRYRDTTWVDQGRFVVTLRRTAGEPWRISSATLHTTTPSALPANDPISADHLIAQLDSAGMRRGAALSLAYQFGAAFRQVENEHAKVRAENDWVAQEVARYPGRLVGFCSLNPLKEYALDEIERCARHPGLTGLKLHFTTSFIDLRQPVHVERLRAVFRLANARRLPIVVHLRTLNPEYGRGDAEIFLRDVLPEAPHIPVQIAHLAGWGGYGRETDEALTVFAEATASGDRRAANLYFDISQVVSAGFSDDAKQLIVRRIRQIGIQRILFAVDGAEAPGKAWESVKTLPLNAAELRALAGNLAPYLR